MEAHVLRGFRRACGCAGDAGYHEFNFSPSLDWAIYRFSAYREGMSPAENGEAPKISVRRGDAGLEVAVGGALGASCLNCVTLIACGSLWPRSSKTSNGRLSYWGLRHPPGKPDFHHPNGFALEVARA